MKIGFFRSVKDWCCGLAEDFGEGVIRHGHEFYQLRLCDIVQSGTDVVCILGAGYGWDYAPVINLGLPVIYVDKGYTKGYWRISAGHPHPGRVGKLGMPDDRRTGFGWYPKPWKSSGEYILLGISGPGYYGFDRIIHPLEYTKYLVQKLLCITEIPIVVRPKPSFMFELQDDRVRMSDGDLDSDLENARVLVTFASNVCLAALLEGVPTLVLGDGVTRSICSTDIADIHDPIHASLEHRIALLNDLAYHQWSSDELRSGRAWEFYNARACSRFAAAPQSGQKYRYLA